jgi:hypothetical protein
MIEAWVMLYFMRKLLNPGKSHNLIYTHVLMAGNENKSQEATLEAL